MTRRCTHYTHFAWALIAILTNPISFSYGDPPPANPNAARQEGLMDGQPDGSREGQVRGPDEGRRAGQQDGYQAGYAQCEREEKQRQYDRGYQDGYNRGEIEGDADGQRQGRSDGLRQGEADGTRDGERRADRDANRDATPPGTAKGIEEANQSDASQKGFADGLIAGDQEARETALAVDYPRGRKAVRDERYAEPIESEEDYSQKPVQALMKALKNLLPKKFKNSTILDHPPRRGHSANPDYRYYNPRRNYPNAVENQAYQDGYRSGYNSGFQSSYGQAFNSAYQHAYRFAWDNGCNNAKNQNYPYDYQRGYDEGKRQGYARAYQRAYDYAFRPAYDQAFREATQRAYSETYPRAYSKHFEIARSLAYSARYKELYNEAHERARLQKFNEMYPQYAEQQYQRGRSDEAQDFIERPVRLLSAEITETIPNGLYEPGEVLHVRVDLRNFSEGAIAGRDVRVQIQAFNPESSVISEAQSVLTRDLKRKSKNTVRGLLELRLNEAALEKSNKFKVTVFYQNKNVGEQDFELSARYMLKIQFAKAPELSEGLRTQITFKIKNQSETPTDANLNVQLRSNPELLEIENPALAIGILNPNEEREIAFNVIARKPDPTLQLPLALEATQTGRRIGLFERTEQVPVLNDYKIMLKSDLAGLKNPGILRAEYVIRNISSRLLLKGLQLTTRIKGDAADSFVALGPNPQYLNPMIQGQTLSFLVPVLVKAPNGGGILELEIHEDGRKVVIHQAKF